MAIYLSHSFDLTVSLSCIILVDAYAVDPVSLVAIILGQRSKLPNDVAKIGGYLEMTCTIFTKNVVAADGLTPNIRDGCIDIPLFTQETMLDVAFDLVADAVTSFEFHDSNLLFGIVERTICVWSAQRNFDLRLGVTLNRFVV